MQTRAEFLEHGLAPALTSTLSALSEEDRDCTICSETLTNAVQLPCHHIFDQECITHWLEIPAYDAPSDRPQRVYQAVREAGLAVDQPGNVDLFSVPQPASSAIARATPAAAQWLIYSTGPVQVHEPGPAEIDVKVLAAHVIAMGNILPALAQQGGRYIPSEIQDWQTLIDRLYVVLKSKNGKRYDAFVMAQQLRRAMNLRGLTLHHDVDSSAVSDFLITENGLDAELDKMLNYVTHVSFELLADQQRSRARAARRVVAERAGRKRQGGCAMM